MNNNFLILCLTTTTVLAVGNFHSPDGVSKDVTQNEKVNMPSDDPVLRTDQSFMVSFHLNTSSSIEERWSYLNFPLPLTSLQNSKVKDWGDAEI